MTQKKRKTTRKTSALRAKVSKKLSAKRTPGWDKLGKMIGTKIGKEVEKAEPCEKSWMFKSHNRCDEGGGFGRLLFIMALLFILNTKGYLVGISTWMLVLLVIGFAMMKL